METFNNEGKKLPYPGGFNNAGELTDVPGDILESWRALPMGYWKGSGLSLLLDIMAAILSGGLSTHQVESCMSEYGISQVFIAINIKSLQNFPSIEDSIHQIIEDLKNSVPDKENTKIRYPGESVIRIRKENLKNGIPVNKDIWEKIMSL
jgi:3-dehydro-L-gulonate 2-dehydrogenase